MERDTNEKPFDAIRSGTRMVSRRKLVTGATATVGAAALASMVAHGSFAQEQSGTSPATPNVLSSTPVPEEVTANANDWPVAQGNLQATRAAVNSPITSETVSKLAPLWTVPITVSGNFSGITANAVIIGDVIYYQDMQSNVFALDRATGKELWRYDTNVPNNGPNGVAVAYGMVFAATGDNSIAFAVDQQSGKLLWQATLSNSDFECIDMAPAVYDNTVYISTNPNNTTYGNYRGGARGILYALDAKTGKTLWSFDTAADNLWGNPRTNSGAGLWYPPSFDENGSMYFGTGNAAPYPGNKEYPSGSSRPKPNDYADSMVSLSLDTGGVTWFINAKPHDLFDHDFQQSPVLAEVTFPNNTEPTLIAVGAGKTGTVIACEAKTGGMLWKTKVGKHENDDLEWLPEGTTRVYPGGLGGVESPIAFGDGKIFAPYIDFPIFVKPDNVDSSAGADITQATGGLAAIDAITGDIVWDVKQNAMVVAGATVVNDLVFSGAIDGYLRAHDIKTGKVVWEWEAPGGLNAPLAVAGDMIVFAAGAPIFVATPENGTPVAKRDSNPQIVALKLGS
ncbi:MAG: PQQ-binding-like beta-propeller repeat protein [Thermomicrobiales bacterium]